MKTIIVDVTKGGATIELRLRAECTSGQAVLVLTDDVEIVQKEKQSSKTETRTSFEEFQSKNGFPPRRLTEQAIVQICKEHGGSVKITDRQADWNIYSEIAARLGVSVEARKRQTSTGESAWRPEVGFAKKNLVEAGIIETPEISGVGIWTLKKI